MLDLGAQFQRLWVNVKIWKIKAYKQSQLKFLGKMENLRANLQKKKGTKRKYMKNQLYQQNYGK